MAYALYTQYQSHIEPCPLCIVQRVAIIVLGALFLLAALHNPRPIGTSIYAALLALAAIAGGAVAGRHIWIQNLPEDQVPACGAPLDRLLEVLPFRKVVEIVLRGDGECHKIDWTFLGQSMPVWVLISCVILGAWGLWANLRASRSATRSG